MRVGSIYDPYKELIEECVGAGLSMEMTAQIVGRYLFEPTKEGIYSYCRARGISSETAKMKSRQERFIHLPNCNDCSECYKVASVDGNSETRVCDNHKQIIANAVVHCPEWCPKRSVTKDSIIRKYDELINR